MHYRILIALLLPLTVAAESWEDIDFEAIAPPPPMSHNAEETTVWPDSFPMLKDARNKEASRTESTFTGRYRSRMGVEEACEFYRLQLEGAGWTIEYESCDEDYFDIYANKPPLDVSLHGYNDMRDGVPAVSIRLSDASIGCAECGQDAVAGIDAPDLWNRVRECYANAKTYSDEGQQVDRFYRTPGTVSQTQNLRFVTDFQRPDRFRFEYADDNRYIVYQNGGDIRSHWTLDDKMEYFDDISSPLGAATGVSGGTASMIPDLLLPEECGGSLISMKHPTAIGADVVDGVHCIVLESCDEQCMPSRVWIDPATLLIHRYEEMTLFSDFISEDVTDYKPRMDHEIPEEDLAFNKTGRVETQPDGAIGSVFGTLFQVLRSFF